MQRFDSINVGEVLRKARENIGLTQEDIAAKLNVGRDAIIRIEKGTRKVSAEELHELMTIYNISIEDILLDEDTTNIGEYKGIILAGGSGTRLYPITQATSKQIIPVYDKPMIFYPLSVLMEANIKDILIITTKEDQKNFKRLLGDGSDFGVNLTYKIQPSPDGLAQAFIIGKDFIGDDACAMVLGDNIFYGSGLNNVLEEATNNALNGKATIFGYQVKDPERFGIMEIEESESGTRVVSVEEKPTQPKSDYAITGLYFYPKGVSKLAEQVKPSARGELEITTLNDMYLKNGDLRACLLGEGYTWFDTGTFNSLIDAANMVRTIESNRDAVICAPEAIGYRKGWLSKDKLLERANLLKKNSYGAYLSKLVEKKGSK